MSRPLFIPTHPFDLFPAHLLTLLLIGVNRWAALRPSFPPGKETYALNGRLKAPSCANIFQAQLRAFDFWFETTFPIVLQKATYWACLMTRSIYVSPEQYVLPLRSGHVL
jgi:hypothetical protein